jgi:hypothetical protein
MFPSGHRYIPIVPPGQASDRIAERIGALMGWGVFRERGTDTYAGSGRPLRKFKAVRPALEK